MTATHNPVVVAFCSPVMSSGKSTAAQHLVERHGFRLLKFAAPLKDMTRALLPHLGIPKLHVEAYVEGGRKESPLEGFGGLTARRIMQTLGTEWGRQTIRADLWTHIVREQCCSYLQAGISVVVDDMRYLNEFETIDSLPQGRCYRIVRPDAPADVTGHSSEGELDGLHMPEIWNRGTVERLYEKLDLVVREA